MRRLSVTQLLGDGHVGSIRIDRKRSIIVGVGACEYGEYIDIGLWLTRGEDDLGPTRHGFQIPAGRWPEFRALLLNSTPTGLLETFELSASRSLRVDYRREGNEEAVEFALFRPSAEGCSAQARVVLSVPLPNWSGFLGVIAQCLVRISPGALVPKRGISSSTSMHPFTRPSLTTDDLLDAADVVGGEWDAADEFFAVRDEESIDDAVLEDDPELLRFLETIDFREDPGPPPLDS